MKRKIAFYELNSWNLILAKSLSLFFDVYYWRATGVSPSGKLSQIDFRDIDSWHFSRSNAYAFLKKYLENQDNIFFKSIPFKKMEPLSEFLSQRFLIQAERRLVFQELVRHNGIEDKAILYDRFSVKYLSKKQTSLLLSSFCFVLALLNSFSSLSNLLKNMAKEYYKYLFLKSSTTPLDDSIWCSGLTPLEINFDPHAKCFDWLTSLEKVSKREVTYFFTSRLSLFQEKKLKDEGFNFIGSNDLYSLINLFDKLSFLLFKLPLSLLMDSFKKDLFLEDYFEFRSEKKIWDNVLKKYKIKKYIASVSEHWPSPARISILNNYNIKTINWSYSSVEFYYSKNTPYDFYFIKGTFNIFKEYWCWNQYICDYFIESYLDCLGVAPEYFNMGAMISSKSHILKKTPKQLRLEMKDKLSLEFTDESLFVSLFDLSPLLDHRRINLGLGPYTNYQDMEDLFQLGVDLLEESLEIKLIIKNKRGLDPSFYYQSKSLKKLQNMKSEDAYASRIYFFEYNIDPCIPVGLSDVVISSPFSSPSVMANIYKHRIGLYCNFQNIANFSYKNMYEEMVIRSTKEVLEKIRDFRGDNQKKSHELCQMIEKKDEIISRITRE